MKLSSLAVLLPCALTVAGTSVFQDAELAVQGTLNNLFSDRSKVHPDLLHRKPSDVISEAEWHGGNDLSVEYSETIANRSLMFAYASYCPKQYISDWSCRFCDKVIPDFQVDLVLEEKWFLAFTGYDPTQNQVVISFRGTANKPGWLYDANIKPRYYPGIDGATIHTGFWDAWSKLRFEVMLSARKLMDNHSGDDILVTGHSLGAALAMVASLEIFQYANDTGNTGLRKVDTFGCPRWGNDVLAAHFMSMVDIHWRVVHYYDIIPKLPPRLMDQYHHAPQQVWYHETDPELKYQVCDGSGEDKACHYRAEGWNEGMEYHVQYFGVEKDCEKNPQGL